MRKNLKKKIIQNKNGGIGLNILILILIFLVSYQFIAPYVGLMSFTDYISDYDNPDVVTIDYEMRNPISKQAIYPSAIFTFGEHDGTTDLINPDEPMPRYLINEYDVFPACAIITNAGFSISEPYYFRIFNTYAQYSYYGNDDVQNEFIIDGTTTLSAEYSISHIADIGKDEYVVDLTNLRQDGLTDGIQSNLVEIYFFNYYGEILFYERCLITKEYNWFR